MRRLLWAYYDVSSSKGVLRTGCITGYLVPAVFHGRAVAVDQSKSAESEVLHKNAKTSRERKWTLELTLAISAKRTELRK